MQAVAKWGAGARSLLWKNPARAHRRRGTGGVPHGRGRVRTQLSSPTAPWASARDGTLTHAGEHGQREAAPPRGPFKGRDVMHGGGCHQGWVRE